ncbi:recombinase RecT [Streptomyces lonarensis]|uniref:Recombinase RecT n=1 Tax=Streptomyces lonarensis TaxID=700599 RepID=A0A7X6CX69_9ACTN|nr:recombinase RecT [Streptomyces lonarensis]NJQ04239.1 recombinase RecT [Streptomyces lonarensis]
MSQISTAVAKRDSGPSAMVQQYKGDLAQVMPQHVRPDVFVRVAIGALRRDKDLAEAATASPATLMSALMTAARLGLEPGSEQFYLVPRKRKGVPEVQGIVGYQGIVEMIYNAGAAQSVVVEVVRAADHFVWRPGAMERPEHTADWFGDRGDLVGVYAYAVMQGGATSKVVVLNRQHIAAAKAKSDGVRSPYSPWNTNEEAMWLKTAARRLGKWVPTSAEKYSVTIERAEPGASVPVGVLDEADPLPPVDEDTGEVIEGEIVPDGADR